MIRIEQFLFEYNVERTQAESLIAKFPNLAFGTISEFVSYFESQNITLNFENKIGVQRQSFQSKDDLLQRFKDFKSSTDYDYVKKYIEEQRKIQDAINKGNIQSSSNLLDGITSQPIDPFFNFIVRKMLTGSETGVLPSESLRSLLDELTKKTKQEIDTSVPPVRDEIGRVVSFDNYLRNKGSLKVNLLDERFTIETFNYVVNKEFNQLTDAISAEKNVLRRAAELDTIFPADATGDGVVDGRDLIENLKKLIVRDSNSVPALQAKLESLQSQLNSINELVDLKDEDINDLARIIEELSDQRNSIVLENEIKDQTIVSLNEVIDATLAELEEKVSEQLTNTTDAFDALSTQIESQAKKAEEQAKRAEENAAKQLAAFEKAIGGIADALKPKEPEPDPENPAGDILKQIFEIWDKVYLIKTSSYSIFLKILKSLKITPPPVADYVYNPPSDSNPYGPGLEISQILKWTNEYKSQFKEVASSITDEKVAKDILQSSKDLLSKGNGIAEIKDIVFDAFKAWRENIGDIRGSGRSIFSKAVLELVPSYKFPGDNPDQRDDNTRNTGQNAIRSASDPELIMKIVKILDETNRISPRADWNSFGR